MITRADLLEIKEDTIKRYKSRYKEFGVSPLSLGWDNKISQRDRFNAIEEELFWGSSLLDIGCGFGDLYWYLQDKDIKMQYTGLDVISYFTDMCFHSISNSTSTFVTRDFMTMEESIPKHDIVIALGLMNYKLSPLSNYEYAEMFMKKAFDLANNRLIIDFISSYRTDKYPMEDNIYYYDPPTILDIAFDITHNVKLLHAYAPLPQKEFTMVLDKDV